VIHLDFGLRYHSGSEWTTMEHETITEYVEFSASGWTTDSGGQMLDDLIGATRLAKGWTFDDVRSLHRIWQSWHLNGMHAECNHLTMQWEKDPTYGYKRLKLDGEGTVCPVSGYRMGRAWLVEPLPEIIIDEVQRLLALVRSTW
jgi:hypothetical protein